MRTELGYVVPCPICKEGTLLDVRKGVIRRFNTDGFPNIHECEVPRVAVPNETDFIPQIVATKSPDFKPQQRDIRRMDNAMLSDWIALMMRDPAKGQEYEAAMAEASRRVKLADSQEVERKRRAI